MDQSVAASTKFTPFWWEGAPPLFSPSSPVAATCDVAIVGAGYTGLAAALTLAQAGRSVQVFDAGVPGVAASSRNGGIASGTIKPGLAALTKAWGEARALAAYAEGAAARRDLRQFISDQGIACSYQLCGRFTGATRPEKLEALKREADSLNRHLEIGATVVTKAQQHREVDTEFYHGGMVRPDIAALDPARFFKGLLDAATRAGAVVHSNAPVTAVARDAGKAFRVTTGKGTTEARDVIVCTNGYTDKSQPWLRRRLVPVGSQMIATEPLPADLISRLMPTRRVFGETKKMSHYYRSCPQGRRILFGGRLYGRHESDQPISFARLTADLTEIFPELAGVGVSHTWWGFVAFPIDMMPLFATHDGVHYAAGYNGSGVVWARWFGIKAALRVLGEAEGASAFAERVYRAIPFYSGKPWFLPAMQAWYGLRDRLGV